LVVRFRIGGRLRFLSHLETMKMFELALKRAGVEFCYSGGFNPRTGLSLPLARSVGLATADDLLCATVWIDGAEASAVEMKKRIAGRLPEGCDIVDVELAGAKTSFTAEWAVYEFPLAGCVDRERLSKRIEELTGRIERGDAVIVERRGRKGAEPRRVDVSGFVESLELANASLVAKCRITPSGSIRVDEILRLLQLTETDIAGAVVRKSVGWQRCQKQTRKRA